MLEWVVKNKKLMSHFYFFNARWIVTLTSDYFKIKLVFGHINVTIFKLELDLQISRNMWRVFIYHKVHRINTIIQTLWVIWSAKKNWNCEKYKFVTTILIGLLKVMSLSIYSQLKIPINAYTYICTCVRT